LAAALSQEKLAQRAKISRTFAGELERGEKAVTLDVIERLSRALKLSASQLIAMAERRR
jgi:transcriptional regulator with XRE-family HTH domain